MSRYDADVLIAGGGLAGAVASLCLARAGLSAVMVDKAVFPRDKPCGEGLLPHGASLLDGLGLTDAFSACEAQPFRGILYRIGDVVARGDFEGGMVGHGLRRRHLDAHLRARAAGAGVRMVQGAVHSVQIDADAAALTLADGSTLRGRFLIGADGPRSTVRHALGLDGGAPRRPRYALRQHFELARGVALPDRVEVNVAGGFEVYVTPVGPRTVGVAALCEKRVMHEAEGRPAQRLRRLIEAVPAVAGRIDARSAASEALACGPLRVRARDVGTHRALLVGDAAGYVDAITGEGMTLGIKTAVLAARALTDAVGGTPFPQVVRSYRRARAALFRDHALLTFGLVELTRHPVLARRAIARLEREPSLFSRLLSVNNGTRTLVSLGALDLLKLAVGSSPRPPRALAA